MEGRTFWSGLKRWGWSAIKVGSGGCKHPHMERSKLPSGRAALPYQDRLPEVEPTTGNPKEPTETGSKANTVGTVIICNFGSQFVEQVKRGPLFPDFGIVAGP